jgi:2-amino-4-hydroxy-6-hydroxymethyldihydropteridine diphosphokinase
MPSFTASSHEPEHSVAIAFGSNIGDRAGNIIAAIQRLRSYVRIDRISRAYETKPVGFTEQPDFLNLACTGFTTLSPTALRDAMARIERQVGRRTTVPLGPRAIDLDLLLYDDLISEEKTCTLPHPGLASRAFVLVPLAEIAPELVHPRSGKTIGELAKAVDRSGVTAREGGLLTRVVRDVQEARPLVPLALNRVGVTGVKTQIELRADGMAPQQSIASVDLFADLDAEHSGVHMSRFSQDLEDALAPRDHLRHELVAREGEEQVPRIVVPGKAGHEAQALDAALPDPVHQGAVMRLAALALRAFHDRFPARLAACHARKRLTRTMMKSRVCRNRRTG